MIVWNSLKIASQAGANTLFELTPTNSNYLGLRSATNPTAYLNLRIGTLSANALDVAHVSFDHLAVNALDLNHATTPGYISAEQISVLSLGSSTSSINNAYLTNANISQATIATAAINDGSIVASSFASKIIPNVNLLKHAYAEAKRPYYRIDVTSRPSTDSEAHTSADVLATQTYRVWSSCDGNFYHVYIRDSHYHDVTDPSQRYYNLTDLCFIFSKTGSGVSDLGLPSNYSLVYGEVTPHVSNYEGGDHLTQVWTVEATTSYVLIHSDVPNAWTDTLYIHLVFEVSDARNN